MNIKRTYLYFIFLFSLIGLNTHAQTIQIDNITVLNDGVVLISWKNYSSSNDFIIKRDGDQSLLYEIARISPNALEYMDSDANADKQPRSYIITLSTDEDNQFSDIVSTVYLTSNYDSCNAQMNFNWKQYEGRTIDWTASKYTLHTEIDGTINSYSINDPSIAEYTVYNIPENVSTSFYLETTWDPSNTNQKSSSNRIYKSTDMPENPDYINAVSASTEGNNVNLKFEIASNTETENYILKKSDSKTGTYSEINSFNTTELEINATDINASPDNTINYYKLVSVDACGNEKTESDIANNIVLNLENQELKNTLNWNFFKENDFVNTNYEIYRVNGTNPAELIRSLQNFNSYTDDLEKLQNEKLSGQMCYFVRAIKSNSPSNYSQSNTKCIYLEPQVYIPEAFTPNGDGKNDLFNAKYSFIPADFEMKIYNRWGNIIFQTNDPEEGWNGKQRNGEPVTTGAYMYYIKISTPGNDPIEKRGNLTVFYP